MLLAVQSLVTGKERSDGIDSLVMMRCAVDGIEDWTVVEDIVRGTSGFVVVENKIVHSCWRIVEQSSGRNWTAHVRIG